MFRKEFLASAISERIPLQRKLWGKFLGKLFRKSFRNLFTVFRRIFFYITAVIIIFTTSVLLTTTIPQSQGWNVFCYHKCLSRLSVLFRFSLFFYLVVKFLSRGVRIISSSACTQTSSSWSNLRGDQRTTAEGKYSDQPWMAGGDNFCVFLSTSFVKIKLPQISQI